MTPQRPYAVYLDSKILGAGIQLSTYFRNRVFDPSNTIIYIREYKNSFSFFRKLFSAQGLTFRCVRSSDLDRLQGQVVFYLFNAQSNCRLVANRSLKHVFVTHGESNKASSIKPITRIYDHVAMSGHLSLQRYYRSGQFDRHDYDTKRLIMVGNTFVGRSGLAKAMGQPVLFYAPTWEGGTPRENYSSLGEARTLPIVQHFARLAGISGVLIKPHPNLGHRLDTYGEYLISLISKLQKAGLVVYLYRNNIRLSILQRMRLHAIGAVAVDAIDNFRAVHALIDVSAMETQCVNEGIPYHVLLKDDMRSLAGYAAPEHLRLYSQIAIQLVTDSPRLPTTLGGTVSDEFRSRLIAYSRPDWCEQAPARRLRSLLDYIAA